jgi:hypothetical protein
VIGVPKEIKDLPGAYARITTQALTIVTYPFSESPANSGLAEPCQRQPALGCLRIALGFWRVRGLSCFYAPILHFS